MVDPGDYIPISRVNLFVCVCVSMCVCVCVCVWGSDNTAMFLYEHVKKSLRKVTRY